MLNNGWSTTLSHVPVQTIDSPRVLKDKSLSQTIVLIKHIDPEEKSWGVCVYKIGSKAHSPLVLLKYEFNSPLYMLKRFRIILYKPTNEA